jgi:putative transposase
MGNMLAAVVHAANIHDTKSGEAVIIKAKSVYPRIAAVCADAGYRGTFKECVESNLDLPVHISEKIKPHEWKKMPWRWVVERTLSWFGGYRLLSRDFEIRTVSQETQLLIANAVTLLRRL